jgi:hypothetical protein
VGRPRHVLVVRPESRSAPRCASLTTDPRRNARHRSRPVCLDLQIFSSCHFRPLSTPSNGAAFVSIVLITHTAQMGTSPPFPFRRTRIARRRLRPLPRVAGSAPLLDPAPVQQQRGVQLPRHGQLRTRHRWSPFPQSTRRRRRGSSPRSSLRLRLAGHCRAQAGRWRQSRLIRRCREWPLYLTCSIMWVSSISLQSTDCK